MYDNLIAALRNVSEYDSGYAKLMYDAADVIEELTCENESLSKSVNEASEILRRRWIPVTERLPKEWWPVLGLIQYHDEKEPPAQQVLWYLGNGHWRETWRGDMIESDVTHWMPLPEPPKEE